MFFASCCLLRLFDPFLTHLSFCSLSHLNGEKRWSGRSASEVWDAVAELAEIVGDAAPAGAGTPEVGSILSDSESTRIPASCWAFEIL